MYISGIDRGSRKRMSRCGGRSRRFRDETPGHPLPPHLIMSTNTIHEPIRAGYISVLGSAWVWGKMQRHGLWWMWSLQAAHWVQAWARCSEHSAGLCLLLVVVCSLRSFLFSFLFYSISVHSEPSYFIPVCLTHTHTHTHTCYYSHPRQGFCHVFRMVPSSWCKG